MLTCSLFEIFDNKDYMKIPPHLKVMLVKVPCAVALHLSLVTEVQQGMEIMKYSNNHPELFTLPLGSQMSFVVGLL